MRAVLDASVLVGARAEEKVQRFRTVTRDMNAVSEVVLLEGVEGSFPPFPTDSQTAECKCSLHSPAPALFRFCFPAPTATRHLPSPPPSRSPGVGVWYCVTLWGVFPRGSVLFAPPWERKIQPLRALSPLNKHFKGCGPSGGRKFAPPRLPKAQ